MDDKYIKTDVEGLVKDRKSNAVLNVDNKRLDAYRAQKNFMAKSLDTSKRLETVENDISQIKKMFQILLEKLDR
jgi:hypothetical protein